MVVTRAGIVYQNNYDSVLDRAQVAAESEDCSYWMIRLQENMENGGLRGGYTSLLYHNPDTDVAQTRAAVQNVIQRLRVANGMEKSSPEYQAAMYDCRGIMREINVDAFGWWTYNASGWVWMYLVCLPIIPAALLIAGVLAALFR